MIRRINRQMILQDDDYVKLVSTLLKAKDKSGFRIYGYCLMGNHVNLLLHEKDKNEKDFSLIINFISIF